MCQREFQTYDRPLADPVPWKCLQVPGTDNVSGGVDVRNFKFERTHSLSTAARVGGLVQQLQMELVTIWLGDPTA